MRPYGPIYFRRQWLGWNCPAGCCDRETRRQGRVRARRDARRMIALSLASILLAGGCGWKTGAVKTLRALDEANRSAVRMVKTTCGPGGAKVATDCVRRKDAACPALVRCEKALRALHGAAVAVLIAKLGIEASDKATALAAVQAAMKAWRPVEALIRGIR